MTKSEAYDKGLYKFNPPPICCAYWTKEDWIAHIDSCGVWLTNVKEKEHDIRNYRVS